jgi:hypothetical protein
MIPVGYLYKTVVQRPDWIPVPAIDDVYSVSGCISPFFTDYVKRWKHNGYWLFNSPDAMESICRQEGIDLSGMTLFFYEAHEMEFDQHNGETAGTWVEFRCDGAFPTKVELPGDKKLAGYDVVAFACSNAPECSPLACNKLATEFELNPHCLFETFEAAKEALESGVFHNAEPGPYRILAVYTV